MEHRRIFDEVSKMLYVWVNGEVRLTGIAEIQDDVLEEKYLPSKLKILEISNGSKAELSNRDVEVILDTMNEKTRCFESVRHAIVQINSKNIVNSTLAELYADKQHYNIKIFTNESAAKNWLMMQ